ncbi:hypothetical protein OQA88_2301 [Cercophora sp. LCS_1]
MPPIDYSKWATVDTDSEGENMAKPSKPAPKATPAPKPNPQPQAQPQAQPQDQTTASASSSTSTTGTTDKIPAVIIRSDGEKRTRPPWGPVTVPSSHPVFSNYPTTMLMELSIPVAFQRIDSDGAPQRLSSWDCGPDADLDNQMVTYMHINPHTGFAPEQWLGGRIGSVVAARLDKKPLHPEQVEGIWMYCDAILDRFGDGNGPPTKMYSKEAFERWWVRYCDEQARIRRHERWAELKGIWGEQGWYERPEFLGDVL